MAISYGPNLPLAVQTEEFSLVTHIRQHDDPNQYQIVPTVTETSIGPVRPVAFAAITQIVLVSVFIYAAGPITGAHFNPLITLGTLCAKLSSLPRTVLYVLFQCLGAVIGAFMLRAALGAKPEDLVVVLGCYIDPTIVTPGQT
jgi:Major intrinsic protein